MSDELERLRRLGANADPVFVRNDWELFLSPATIGQKAGCATEMMRRMVAKELVDNALDASDTVTIEAPDDDTITVTDNGPGMDGAQVAAFFAINRPLASTKLWRLPTRGTLGNGLRVVTGAAIGSGGSLTVESQGQRHGVAGTEANGQIVASLSSSFLTPTAFSSVK